MDESRKQFEESWLRRGGESSDLIRYPEITMKLAAVILVVNT